jgi:hypothetical protein
MGVDNPPIARWQGGSECANPSGSCGLSLSRDAVVGVAGQLTPELTHDLHSFVVAGEAV